jgi:putrescine transport system substrate-binding protein
VLNVYNWSDYIAEDTLKNFEKETGIKVRYDNFDNNEILHAKLVAGKTGYDIVVPASHWAKLQIDGGLLQKLDKAQLPNWNNLDPAVQKQLAKIDPGNEYLVNWLWGYTTVGINVGKVKAALGSMPMPDNPWDLVFKPEYISKLKGCGVKLARLGVRGAAGGAALPGQAAVQQEPAKDYDAAARAAEGRAAARHAVQSSGYINDMANGSLCVVLGWSGDINIARQRAIDGKTGRTSRRCSQAGGAAVLRRDGDPKADAPRARATRTSSSTTSCAPRCTPG